MRNVEQSANRANWPMQKCYRMRKGVLPADGFWVIFTPVQLHLCLLIVRWHIDDWHIHNEREAIKVRFLSSDMHIFLSSLAFRRRVIWAMGHTKPKLLPSNWFEQKKQPNQRVTGLRRCRSVRVHRCWNYMFIYDYFQNGIILEILHVCVHFFFLSSWFMSLKWSI